MVERPRTTDELRALARDAERKIGEYEDAGLPVAAEVTRFVDAFLNATYQSRLC